VAGRAFPWQGGPFPTQLEPVRSSLESFRWQAGLPPLLSTTMSFVPSISAEGEGEEKPALRHVGMCHGQILVNPKK
jgi:hypothetical protein